MKLLLLELMYFSLPRVQPCVYFNYWGKYNEMSKYLIYILRNVYYIWEVKNFPLFYIPILHNLGHYESWASKDLVNISAVMLAPKWMLNTLCLLSIMKTSFIVCDWAFLSCLFSHPTFSLLTTHLQLHTI
jgi:hypothetical protein